MFRFGIGVLRVDELFALLAEFRVEKLLAVEEAIGVRLWLGIVFASLQGAAKGTNNTLR